MKSLYMAISVLMADGSTKHTDIMSNIMQNTCGVEMWRSQYNYIMNPIIHLFTWDIKLYFCTLETSYFMLWYLEWVSIKIQCYYVPVLRILLEDVLTYSNVKWILFNINLKYSRFLIKDNWLTNMQLITINKMLKKQHITKWNYLTLFQN